MDNLSLGGFKRLYRENIRRIQENKRKKKKKKAKIKIKNKKISPPTEN